MPAPKPAEARAVAVVVTLASACGAPSGAELFTSVAVAGNVGVSAAGGRKGGSGSMPTSGSSSGAVGGGASPTSGGSSAGGSPPDPPDSGVPPDPCSPSGVWGYRVELPVTWPASAFVLLEGKGVVVQRGLVRRSIVSASEFSDETRPCSILLPDLEGDVLQYNQRFGIRFPDAPFDAGGVPTFAHKSSVHMAATGVEAVSEPVVTLLGHAMPDGATGDWPPSPLLLEDHDGDGAPGVTVEPATGARYSYPPVGLPPVFADLPRADLIYIITRTVTTLRTKQVSCNAFEGSVEVHTIGETPAINSKVIGCRRLRVGAPCTAGEAEFVDGSRPQFYPDDLGSIQMIRLPESASCADVRAALPN